MATRKHFSYQTPAGEEKPFEVDTPPAGTIERAILATKFGLDPPSIKFNGRSYSPDAAGQYHLPVGVGDDPADPVCVTGTPTGEPRTPNMFCTDLRTSFCIAFAARALFRSVPCRSAPWYRLWRRVLVRSTGDHLYSLHNWLWHGSTLTSRPSPACISTAQTALAL